MIQISGSSLAVMPSTYAAGCSVTIGTKVYIIGGIRSDGSVSDALYVYDTTLNRWQTLSPMTKPRFAAGCMSYIHTIFVFGGQSRGNGFDHNTIEIYDIERDAWNLSTQVMSYSAHWLSAVYLKVNGLNLAIIMGGSSGFNPVIVYHNLDIYDLDTDKIIGRENMTQARYAFSAISVNGKYILMAGGSNGQGQMEGSINAIYCDNQNV